MNSLIKNHQKFQQPLIYDGLYSRGIYPTDIDAIIELYNKYLIIFEVKVEGKDINTGQEISFKRMVDAWNDSGQNKVGLLVVVNHNINDPKNAIYLKDCLVKKVYFSDSKTWKNVSTKTDVISFLSLFATKYKISHLQDLVEEAKSLN